MDVRSIAVTDDIASAARDELHKRRGIAGDLTVFKVAGAESPQPGQVTRPGLMHLCFEVDNAHETLAQMLAAGGSVKGEIVDSGTITGVGRADFCYARDPDGNILELVSWNAEQSAFRQSGLRNASRPF